MWRRTAMGRLGLAPKVDLSHRADPAELHELMDTPGSYEELRACLRDLAKVNRVTGAYRPTLRFLDGVLAERPGVASLSVLDLGSGYGDMLREVRRWGRRRGIELDLVGADLEPFAARAAEEADAEAAIPAGEIRWFTGDAFGMDGPAPDVVISSLVMHHLRDADVVDLLRWMERVARAGWFVNDLERAERPYRWFGVLARLMRWHPFVQHDGPVSFRRAFQPQDWQRLLAQAGVSGAKLVRSAPARLCVARLRGSDGQH